MRERDIWVTLSQTNFKPAQQCLEAARKAGTVLTKISRDLFPKDKKKMYSVI